MDEQSIPHARVVVAKLNFTHWRKLRDAPKVGVIFEREQYSRAILNEAIMETRYRYQYRKSCIGVYSFLEMPHSTQFCVYLIKQGFNQRNFSLVYFIKLQFFGLL